MVYLYYGENLHLLEKKLQTFRERYRAKFLNSLNIYNLDFTEEGLEHLRTIIKTHTLFTETKLVFISTLSALSAEQDAWVRDLLKKNKMADEKETVIVFYERASKKQTKKAKKLFIWIEKNGTTQEFEPYSGARLERWVIDYVKDRGGKIEKSATRALILRASDDMVRLSNELDKLLSYSNYSEVDEKTVTMLIPAVVSTNAFKTIDALADRDISRALFFLQEHEEAGDDPFQLMGMFAYEIRVLLLINEACEEGTEKDLQEKHNLHPFVVKKNRTRARAFSKGELLLLHNLLTNTDVAIKTGQKEPYEGLEDVILGFVGSRPSV